MNHVHKYSKAFLSVIITLGKYIRGGGGYTVFYYGVKTSDLGSRSHVLTILQRRMIFGPFEICFHEGNLWIVHRAVISFIITKQIFLHFYRHGDRFYSWYINKTDKRKYLDDNITGVKPKYFLQEGMRYSPGYDPIQKIWGRDRKIARKIGIKRKSTKYMYLPG